MSGAGGESKETTDASSTSGPVGPAATSPSKSGGATGDFSTLEQFSIFNKKGHVLWQQHPDHNALVNHLIDSVLVQERQGEHKEEVDEFIIKWIVQVDLIFVCVYRRLFQLMYIDELLHIVQDKFNEMYDRAFVAGRVTPVDDFGDNFANLLRGLNARKVVPKMRRFTDTPKGLDVLQIQAKKGVGGGADAAGGGGGGGSRKKKKKNKRKKKKKNGGAAAGDGGSGSGSHDSDDDVPAGEAGAGAMAVAGPGTGVPRPYQGKDKKGGKGGKSGKGGKGRPKKMAEPSSHKALDHSAPDQNGGGAKLDVDVKSYGPSEMEEPAAKSSGWSLGVSNLFKRLSGSKVLEDSDLEAPLQAMKNKLVEKNAAADIADKVCESVRVKLIGQKVGTFERTAKLVGEALREALVRILTPNRSIDVLRSALEAKQEGRPYVVVFIGVNGVGKSTSLSKVCHYLMENGLTVMMAACDTFRSGAVEQLKEHGRRLNVDVYDKGYCRYPSQVAQGAVKHAKQNGVDVVLVDTAGRMQNNTKLMQELALLVADNDPDLCLFVGEALVGNDGVDQLMCFNKALVDHGRAVNPRVIDGIILSKFDTIDDKVGAALSMVYRSKVPVVFVGTGQKYTNLRRLNVDSVIQSLFR